MSSRGKAPPVADSAKASTAKGVQVLPDDVYKYLMDHTREADVLRRLREATTGTSGAEMQVPPEQGAFLSLLLELMGAQRVIELGTFSGYSTIAFALALPSDGKVVTVDNDGRAVEGAKKWFMEAKVEGKIEPRLGNGMDILDDMLNQGEEGKYDFAFIDADKRNYSNYVDRLARLVRRGGCIAIDNVLWYGKVADQEDSDNSTQAIRDVNDSVLQDDRFSVATVPIGDGVTLLRLR